MAAPIAMVLGIGLGIAAYPVLHMLLGSWASVLALALIIGSIIAWWRRP